MALIALNEDVANPFYWKICLLQTFFWVRICILKIRTVLLNNDKSVIHWLIDCLPQQVLGISLSENGNTTEFTS
jgi:hypothetical protein